jgi:hypothetical protein
MPFALTSGFFGRFSKGSTPWLDWLGRLAVPIWSAFNFMKAREPVRNTVEIVRKEPGVDVERHRRRGVTEHLLHRLDVGACRHGEAGRGVTQFVGVSPDSPT